MSGIIIDEFPMLDFDEFDSTGLNFTQEDKRSLLKIASNCGVSKEELEYEFKLESISKQLNIPKEEILNKGILNTLSEEFNKRIEYKPKKQNNKGYKKKNKFWER